MFTKRLALTAGLILGTSLAWGDDVNYATPPPGASMNPAFSQTGSAPVQPANPYATAWPPAGQPAPDGRVYDVGSTNWIAPPSQAPALPVMVAPPADYAHQSSWYYRLDSFYWNERIDGADFVKEYGPLSTIGYVHRSGVQRFRIELFGGTVSHEDVQAPDEPTFNANYLGCRGEYDLLIEPVAWSKLRFVVGVGTRFWIRDFVVPLGGQVFGYQETWWTFYPYIGLETRESPEPGLKLFGSIRVGATPLTYQYATYYENTVFPRCGVTGQAEFGVRCQRFAASVFLEAMTWGASAVVENPYGDYTYQPDSRMLTIGGKLSYTF